MNFLQQNWYLVAIALVTGGMLLWPMLRTGGSVSVMQAVFTLNREKGVLVDVREAAEFARSRAPNAVNVALTQLEERKEALPKNKKVPLIVLCQTGSRAEKAAASLRKAGYEQVQVVRGGMQAWVDAQMPTESGEVASATRSKRG